MSNYNVGDTFECGNSQYKIVGFTDSNKSAYVQNVNYPNIQRTARIGKFFGTPKMRINGVVFWKITN